MAKSAKPKEHCKKTGLPESRVVGNRYDKLDASGSWYEPDAQKTVYFDARSLVFMHDSTLPHSEVDVSSIRNWSDIFTQHTN